MNSLTTLATNGASDAVTLALNFLVFIVLAGVLFFFGNRSHGQLVAFIVSLYVGFVVYLIFPYASLFKNGSGALTETITSLVLYAVFVGLTYYILHKNVSAGLFSMRQAGVVVLSILTAGFLIALSYHSFSLEGIYTFPAAMETYFAPAQYFFWWFIAPLVGLAIVAR